MRRLRNSKEDFVNSILEKIDNGELGLNEIEYLNENHLKYHLTYEDISNFLLHLYEYVYTMAMEDGIITELEQKQLAEIKNFPIHPMPKNRFERDLLKTKILTLVKRIEKTNSAQEEIELENDLAEEMTLKQKYSENTKEKINKLYYKNYLTPYPKLKPFAY